jgi:hypothetical protein
MIMKPPIGKFGKHMGALFITLSFVLAGCAVPSTAPPVMTPVSATETLTPLPTVQVEKPTIVQQSMIDSLALAPEQAAAMKAHSGLEASIIAVGDGTFSTSVQVLNTEGQPTTETMRVDPSSMHEDLTSKNEYGDTPVMTTVDGKKLYWIQEEKTWFAVEISPDIDKPVFVPFDKREVSLRVVIAEFNQPFSQAAVERWKTSPGLVMGFQYLQTSAHPGGTKFGFLSNQSLTDPGLNPDNTPVQILDAWFTTSLPDGTTYQFYPTKWFDPTNPKNPDSNEWKIIFIASGQEIMGDKGNREKFDALLARAASGDNHEVVPIIRIQSGFFDSTNGLITFGVAQPSLAKLFNVSGNKMDELPNPGHDGNPYQYTFDYHFSNLSSTNTSIGAAISRDDPKYHGFFPQDIQMILFPSLIIFH